MEIDSCWRCKTPYRRIPDVRYSQRGKSGPRKSRKKSALICACTGRRYQTNLGSNPILCVNTAFPASLNESTPSRVTVAALKSTTQLGDRGCNVAVESSTVASKRQLAEPQASWPRFFHAGEGQCGAEQCHVFTEMHEVVLSSLRILTVPEVMHQWRNGCKKSE
jgi:hypothetical protein